MHFGDNRVDADIEHSIVTINLEKGQHREKRDYRPNIAIPDG